MLSVDSKNNNNSKKELLLQALNKKGVGTYFIYYIW